MGNILPFVWLYSHLILQAGLTATGVALNKVSSVDIFQPPPAKYAWSLTFSLSLSFLSTAILHSVTKLRFSETSGRIPVFIRSLTALLFLLLAAVSSSFNAGVFIAIICALCVAQVLFDMSLAPMLETVETTHAMEASAEEPRPAEAARPENRPRVIGDAIRKGTPSELRKDIYFFFMEGSWLRLFSSLASIYLLSNIFFAGVYMLQPGSISNARPQSFADAFFFSVQTMSTIGYGVLSPANTFGNIVVAVEAAFGLLGVAMVTGLVFAKASRPRASILFSRVCILTRMDGKNVIAFRAGNARGNDIIDATVTFSALIDTYTREGQHIRRVQDLKTTRERTPFFRLSWLVMHEIDAASPLREIDWENPGKHLIGLTALIVGHDGTYGQTVYARHVYYPDDVRYNHHFRDVLHTLPDGRMLIDYEKFHDTIPMEAEKPANTKRKRSR